MYCLLSCNLQRIFRISSNSLRSNAKARGASLKYRFNDRRGCTYSHFNLLFSWGNKVTVSLFDFGHRGGKKRLFSMKNISFSWLVGWFFVYQQWGFFCCCCTDCYNQPHQVPWWNLDRNKCVQGAQGVTPGWNQDTCPTWVCRAMCGYRLLHRDNKFGWRETKRAKGTCIPMLMWRLSQKKSW